jgi:hypothetical protein
MSFCSLASEIKLIKRSSVALVLVRYRFNPWMQDSHLIIWSERVKIKNNETFLNNYITTVYILR